MAHAWSLACIWQDLSLPEEKTRTREKEEEEEEEERKKIIHIRRNKIRQKYYTKRHIRNPPNSKGSAQLLGFHTISRASPKS